MASVNAQIKRGSAELAVLTLLAERPLHGYELAKQIEAQTEGVLRFDIASLYPMLPCSTDWNERAGSRRNGKPSPTAAAAAATGSPPLAESKSRRSVLRGVPSSRLYRASRGFKMPDWKQIVGKNLCVLGVCSPDFTEELAGHLEDTYEALLCEGLPAEVAFQHTIRQVEGSCRFWLVMRFLQEELMTGFIAG